MKQLVALLWLILVIGLLPVTAASAVHVTQSLESTN